MTAAGVNSAVGPLVLVLEHDASDPLLRLGEWLGETRARLDVRRLYAGDTPPSGTAGFDAIISLGGEMGAHDDDVAPWLPTTRALLGAAAADGTPTLGICLGAQLLAAATGGAVVRGPDGPEIGAYLTAKRDAAEDDPLFARVPLTPDVMQYHHDVIAGLPPGAVLLLAGTTYPNQAFRVGTAAWGLQFHIETSAADLRSWHGGEPVDPAGRLGAMLDEAQQAMGEVWRDFAHRFVDLAGSQRGATRPLRRIPLLPADR